MPEGLITNLSIITVRHDQTTGTLRAAFAAADERSAALGIEVVVKCDDIVIYTAAPIRRQGTTA